MNLNTWIDARVIPCAHSPVVRFWSSWFARHIVAQVWLQRVCHVIHACSERCSSTLSSPFHPTSSSPHSSSISCTSSCSSSTTLRAGVILRTSPERRWTQLTNPTYILRCPSGKRLFHAFTRCVREFCISLCCCISRFRCASRGGCGWWWCLQRWSCGYEKEENSPGVPSSLWFVFLASNTSRWRRLRSTQSDGLSGLWHLWVDRRETVHDEGWWSCRFDRTGVGWVVHPGWPGLPVLRICGCRLQLVGYVGWLLQDCMYTRYSDWTLVVWEEYWESVERLLLSFTRVPDVNTRRPKRSVTIKTVSAIRTFLRRSSIAPHRKAKSSTNLLAFSTCLKHRDHMDKPVKVLPRGYQRLKLWLPTHVPPRP